MSYVALYRKWRPQDFSSLVGQEHIRTALCNALTGGRVAHAYLFAGPRGTGKTSTAKILAKAVNCEQGPTPNPCNVCANCQRINDGSSMDVFEIDAASNRGIDEIRSLREQVRFSPVEGAKRVYIIDEVHMLTTEAFNALLKTLEEPPPHVLFILATTEPHKIPATIHSRCQRYDFRRMGVEDTIARLKEVAAGSGLEAEEEALSLIAAQADGGMRDALSLLDQCSVMAEGAVTAETVRSLLGVVGREHLRLLVGAVGKGEEVRAFEILDEVLDSGKDIRQVLGETASYLRAVMLFKVAPSFSDIYVTDDKANLEKAAVLFSHERLTAAAKRLHEALLEFRFTMQPRLTAEICLLDLCRVPAEGREEELLARVERLERLLGEKKTALPQEKAAPVKEKPIAVQEEAAKPPPVVESRDLAPAAEKISPVPAEAGLWGKILERLLAERKKSLHACIKEGRLLSASGGKLLVEFDNDFPCQRMKKDDYRSVVDKIASELAGQALSLECVTAQAAPVPAPADEEQAAPVDEIPFAAKQALEIFGGELIKLKNKER